MTLTEKLKRLREKSLREEGIEHLESSHIGLTECLCFAEGIHLQHTRDHALFDALLDCVKALEHSKNQFHHDWDFMCSKGYDKEAKHPEDLHKLCSSVLARLEKLAGGMGKCVLLLSL